MRKLFCSLFVGFFIVLIPALAISEESVLQLTDGYFQIELSMPHHLACKAIEKQYLRLEDSFRIWIMLKIKEDKQGPCPRRGEETCVTKLEISGKDLEGKEKIWVFWDSGKRNEKFDDEISYNFGSIHLLKTVAFGNAKIIFRITDKSGEKNFYLLEIPVEIR